LFGGKVIPPDGVVLSGIAPVVVLHDLAGAFDDLAAKEGVGVIKVHPDQLARVEQPVVVIGELSGVRPVARQVADVLARPVGELSTPHAEAAVVGERQADHPYACEASPLGRSVADHGQPVLHPRQVVLLLGEELPQRLVLIVRVVTVAHFQAKRCVLERLEELAELFFGQKAQCAPSSM
jgi:hypothetical protein